jgi:hypothetical protein
MKPTVSTKKMEIKNVNDIRSLYEELKKSRQLKNWGEFADMIGYDRTYISRVVNEHEPLTDEVKNKIIDTFINATHNVPYGTTNGTIVVPIPDDKDKMIREMQKQIVRLEARVNVLTITLVEITGLLKKKEGALVDAELSQAIDLEAKRLLVQLREKLEE